MKNKIIVKYPHPTSIRKGEILILDIWMVFANTSKEIKLFSQKALHNLYMHVIRERERNFGLRRRPTWIKCMFDPPPIQCPQDKGMEVKIYSPLWRVDTLVTSNQ